MVQFQHSDVNIQELANKTLLVQFQRSDVNIHELTNKALLVQFQQLADGSLDQTHVLRMSERLLNHTEENTYINPIDIATVIDLMSILVETQVREWDV